MWLVVKGQARAAAQNWMFLTPKLSPNPLVVTAEVVCESACLSNQNWAWQVEGWGCSWEVAETSYGASCSGLQPDQWSIPDLATEAPGSCVRARKEVKPVSGSSPRAPQRRLVPFSMGIPVNWLGSCVLACTFSPCSSRDHVPLINECKAV